jgi:hypothetical protein
MGSTVFETEGLDSPGRFQVDKGEGQALLLEADVVLLAFWVEASSSAGNSNE